MNTIRRRDFLWQGAALGGTLIGARYAFAAPERGESRFVCIVLRGALDGLAAVPHHGDADYAKLRRDLAIAAPGAEGGALPLDHTFGLNPGLKFLHECYGAGELAVFHAVASPYRERSHFDGQDVLENGSNVPHSLQIGWLHRALGAKPPG